MAHHSGQVPDQALSEEFRNIFGELGATGGFPEGKLHESDEGELKFAVGIRDNKVVIEFGTPVAWCGMTADQAEELGNLLIGRAAEVKAKAG